MSEALVHLVGCTIGWLATGLITSGIHALVRRARRKRLLAYRQWRSRGGDPGMRLNEGRPTPQRRLTDDRIDWMAPFICQGCGNTIRKIYPRGEWERPYCSDSCPPPELPRPFAERTAPAPDRPPPTRIPSAGVKRSM